MRFDLIRLVFRTMFCYPLFKHFYAISYYIIQYPFMINGGTVIPPLFRDGASAFLHRRESFKAHFPFSHSPSPIHNKGLILLHTAATVFGADRLFQNSNFLNIHKFTLFVNKHSSWCYRSFFAKVKKSLLRVFSSEVYSLQARTRQHSPWQQRVCSRNTFSLCLWRKEIM